MHSDFMELLVAGVTDFRDCSPYNVMLSKLTIQSTTLLVS